MNFLFHILDIFYALILTGDTKDNFPVSWIMELLKLFSFLAVIILALLVLVCHISSQRFFLYILLYWAINSPAISFSQDHTWYNSQTYWKGIETVLVCKLVCSNAKGIIRWFKKKNLYCWLLSHGYFTNQSYFVEQLIQSRHECPNQQCKFASQISSGLNPT